MSLSSKYPIIEKIIENWYLCKTPHTKIPDEIESAFKSWSGITFTEFKTKIHPKFIQKKLKGTNNIPNLFHNPSTNTNPILTNVEIIKWELKDDTLNINYNFQNTLFGELLIATTAKGICWAAFIKDQEIGFEELQSNFSNATFKKNNHLKCNYLFSKLENKNKIILHVKGSNFQHKIWNALLTIPLGHLKSYGDVSEMVNLPKEASRAVGTAISKNPVALYIPCHRIVRSSGIIGNFRWKQSRKIALIGWEDLNLSTL